jgi:hypothetical protein
MAHTADEQIRLVQTFLSNGIARSSSYIADEPRLHEFKLQNKVNGQIPEAYSVHLINGQLEESKLELTPNGKWPHARYVGIMKTGDVVRRVTASGWSSYHLTLNGNTYFDFANLVPFSIDQASLQVPFSIDESALRDAVVSYLCGDISKVVRCLLGSATFAMSLFRQFSDNPAIQEIHQKCMSECETLLGFFVSKFDLKSSVLTITTRDPGLRCDPIQF